MNPIVKGLTWLWNHREDLMATATEGMTFYGLAAQFIMNLLKKTPDGNPASVTDAMVDELLIDFKGALPKRSEITETGGEPDDEADDDGTDE